MIDFFLKRRVLTNLVTFFVIVAGIYNFIHVRREAFPEISFDWVSITTMYPGGSPQEVEKLVTNVIEDQLRGVDGLDRVQSYSLEGRSLIVVRLQEDLSEIEKAKTVNDVEQAVNRATDLPDEAEEPLVDELTSDQPLITLSVAGGDDVVRDDLADEIADVIEDVPGVSRVDQTGDLKKEIWAEVDLEKLTRYRLTLGEVAAKIGAQNIDASAGSVDIGSEEVRVRVVNSKDTADEIADIILRGNDARDYLRVRDVARVVERYEDARFYSKAVGQRSINLNVRKVKSGDTVKLADAVREIKAKYEPIAKEKGITLVISDDISFFIKRRLNVMTNNIVQGGVLILIALFVFLDWRLALVAAIGVPISFASVFMLTVPFGFTINLMSMLAFIIVLGMLDDDSVVVAENIYRHLEMGKEPMKAAIDGAKEVVLPVLGAVAVSCAGFLPFAMVSGILGKFLIMIPIVIIVAFVASLLEAFFILPAHVVDLMPFGRPIEESSGPKWFTAVQKFYRRTMSWVIVHRLKFLGIVGVFLVFTGALASWRLRFVLFPEGLVDQFFIDVEMPEGSSLAETGDTFQRVEDIIVQMPSEELEALTGMVGMRLDTSDQSPRFGTQYAQARVFLTAEEKRARRTKVIIEDLRKKIDAVSGPKKVTFQELKAGPPVGRAIDLRVRGKDRATIYRIADEIKAEMAKTKGIIDIKDSREGGKDELHIVLKDREAGFANLNAARVAGDILYAVDGGEATKIRRATEEVKVKVRLLPEQRSKPEQLLQLDVLNEQNRPVRLGEVARIERVPGLPFLEHYNFKPTVQVSADVDNVAVTSQEATKLIAKKFEEIAKAHPGYEIIFGGEAEETAKSMNSLFRAFGFALLLDYVILASLFGSYLQPFIIILLTVPIGLMGVVYALLLHGQPASFMALLGVVAMTGVVINNAIVLVSFINNNRAAGMDLKEAVLSAGQTRLRPIWASSITTLLGLFPTAYGWGGKEPFVAPMALSLAWGLTFAMPMTLFLIPMAYVIVANASETASRAAGRLKDRLLPPRRPKA